MAAEQVVEADPIVAAEQVAATDPIAAADPIGATEQIGATDPWVAAEQIAAAEQILARVTAGEELLATLRASIDARAPDAVDGFLRRLFALPERSMRGLVLTERLLRFDAIGCLAVLQGLLDGALRRDPIAQEALLDLTTTRPLLQRFGYERSRALYELARAREQLALARLLLSPETLGRRRDVRAGDENRHLPDTALGWRKTLARGPDRDTLDRLCFDQHPIVVYNLLRNPRIRERDVVRIAAMRPANPECLDVVFAHPDWIRRYHIKVALVLNPDTPLDIGLTLLPQLLEQDLRHAAVAEKLDPVLTRDAAELLERRRLVRSQMAPTRPIPEEHPELDLEQVRRSLDEWMAP